MDFAVIKNIQLKAFDTFQVSHPREYIEQPVKIIDIDEESLAHIGQWPWPRNILADMVNKLSEGSPAAIGFDIVFAEEDRTSPKNILPLWGQKAKLHHLISELPDHDLLLSKAIANSNVVTGFVLTLDEGTKLPKEKAGFSYTGVDPRPYLQHFSGGVPSLDLFEDVSQGNGALNSAPDKDGILRRTSIILTANGKFFPTLAMESLRIAQGASSYVIKSTGASDEPDTGKQAVTSVKVGQFAIPTDDKGKLLVYYTGHRKERFFPAWKILEPDFDPSQFAGYILLFGTSASGLKDIRATPFDQTTAGIEVHAEVIEQILGGQYLYRPDIMDGIEISLMFILGIALIAIMANFSALTGAVFTVMILSSAVWFSWHMFITKHMLIDPITPGIAIILVFISESLLRYMTAERERKEVRNAFSHYMSPALVSQLANNPQSLKLGGEIKNLTMLFCDIRGFTTISEGLSAEELTSFINKFLTPMTNIILKHKGTIDKYMGDCIMAFWNAPLDDENHPSNASIAALEMIAELKELNERQKIIAKEHNRKFIPINIGIGLNTGDACVGNMGSDQRFDYSVLGDDVNLASRLEGQSKNYGVNIVIGENTKTKATDFASLELDIIRVKGKKKPVTIYTLLGDAAFASNDNFMKLKNNFADALKAYRSKKWDEALQKIATCKEIILNNFSNDTGAKIDLSGLFALYESRIANFQTTPPPEDWDGVYTATEK